MSGSDPQQNSNPPPIEINLNEQLLDQSSISQKVPHQLLENKKESRVASYLLLAHTHKMHERERKKMQGYETLDYEVIENQIEREKSLAQTKRNRRNLNIANWCIFMLIGLSTGATAFAMDTGVHWMSYARWTVSQKIINCGLLGIGFLEFFLSAVLYSFIAAVLVAFVSPSAAGSGIPEVKAYLNGISQPELLTFKTLVTKIVGVCFSVGGGMICGKEGPLVHTGSIFANIYSHIPKLGNLLKLPQLKVFRNDHDKRDFVSGGAAAGVANFFNQLQIFYHQVSAAFGAPVGGILFSLEEASSFWSTPLTWKVFLCSCLSTFSLNFCKSAYNGNPDTMDNPGLLVFGFDTNTKPFHLWELPFWIVIGIIGGLAGGLFNQLNFWLHAWRREHFLTIKWLRIGEAVFYGAFTAVCFFWASAMSGSCKDIPREQCDNPPCPYLDTEDVISRYWCNEDQYSEAGLIAFNTLEDAIKCFFHGTLYKGYWPLTWYFIISFICADITYGSSVPSGLFVPCIVIGAAYGRIVGQFTQDCFKSDFFPGVYSFLGACGMLAGSSRITISLTVILVETTGNVLYIIPIIIVVTIAKQLGDQFNISLYDMHVELKAMPFVEPLPNAGYEQLEAQDLMSYPVQSIRVIEKVGRIYDLLRTTTHNGFPVLSEDSKIHGIMLRNHLIILLINLELLLEDNFDQLTPPKKRLELVYFSTTMSSKILDITKLSPKVEELIKNNREHVLDMRPYMNTGPYVVYSFTKLSKVFRLYRAMGLRHLPVVDDNNQVVGMLTRKELMTDFKQDLF